MHMRGVTFMCKVCETSYRVRALVMALLLICIV